jgi:DNA-binding CsgD family transcriptional regulator
LKENHRSDEASYIANLPGFICVKDLNYAVSAISRDCALLCGWKGPEQAIGHTDHDIPCEAAKYADEFIKLDKLSVATAKKLQSVQIISYNSEWKVILSERTPAIDENNSVTKLYISAMDMTNTSYSKGILLLGIADKKMINTVNKPANYIVDYDHQPLPLTQKQELCLFLLIRGKTMKQIATILGISIKTVEDHLDSIKIKLNCHSKTQLIEKAIESGFFYYIPKLLFQDNWQK